MFYLDPLYELQKQIYPPVRTQSQHFLNCQSSFIIVPPSASVRTLLHTAQSLRKTLTGALISPSFSSSSLCWCALTRVLCHVCKHLWVWFCFAEVLMLESLPIDATLYDKTAADSPALEEICHFSPFSICASTSEWHHCGLSALRDSCNVQKWRKMTY